jgi:hypothetical protein
MRVYEREIIERMRAGQGNHNVLADGDRHKRIIRV